MLLKPYLSHAETSIMDDSLGQKQKNRRIAAFHAAKVFRKQAVLRFSETETEHKRYLQEFAQDKQIAIDCCLLVSKKHIEALFNYIQYHSCINVVELLHPGLEGFDDLLMFLKALIKLPHISYLTIAQCSGYSFGQILRKDGEAPINEDTQNSIEQCKAAIVKLAACLADSDVAVCFNHYGSKPPMDHISLSFELELRKERWRLKNPKRDLTEYNGPDCPFVSHVTYRPRLST